MSDSGSLGRSTRAAVWIGFYIFCWLLMGLSCEVDLPPDCRRASEPIEVLTEVPVLVAFALGQAVFCDILDAERFQGLRSKVYFPVVVIASGLIISAFTRVEELAGLRDTDGDFTTFQSVVSIVLIAFVVSAVLYHFLLAWRVLPGAVLISGGVGGTDAPPENRFVHYCFVCVLVVAHVSLFGAFAFEGGDGWGYQYALLAWVLSLLARFDDTLSVMWLGLTSAAFLQCVGAYSLSFLPQKGAGG